MNTSRNESTRVLEEERTVGRVALIGMFVVLALLAGALRLLAQDPMQSAGSRGAIRPFVGAYVPTGDQRDFLKDAVLVGAQASWNATSNVAVTGSFGWVPSEDKISAAAPKIDLYQYDLGIELRSLAASVGSVSPFVGIGAGGRTYNYRDLDVDSKTNFDGYGALGLDAAAGPVDVRLEARDYISRFQPFAGGESKTRNDVALFAALGWRF